MGWSCFRPRGVSVDLVYTHNTWTCSLQVLKELEMGNVWQDLEVIIALFRQMIRDRVILLSCLSGQSYLGL
jgi:hypothetical protein